MTRLLFALLGAVAFAALAMPGPAQAIKFYKGKNGNSITCTYDDCVAYCKQVGGRPAGCPGFCTKAIADRKASGECK